MVVFHLLTKMAVTLNPLLVVVEESHLLHQYSIEVSNSCQLESVVFLHVDVIYLNLVLISYPYNHK